MKLLMLNTTVADAELINYLAKQTGLEVITINSSQLANVASQRTSESKLQAFQSLIDGKQTREDEVEDEVDWEAIDNLPYNKEIDENHQTLSSEGEVKWETIDNLPHNKEVDESQ
jgi:hypothetical protein